MKRSHNWNAKGILPIILISTLVMIPIIACGGGDATSSA